MTADQMQVTAETVAVIKMAPRRPNICAMIGQVLSSSKNAGKTDIVQWRSEPAANRRACLRNDQRRSVVAERFDLPGKVRRQSNRAATRFDLQRGLAGHSLEYLRC